MDLPIHDQILWQACVLAEARLNGSGIDQPTKYFPLLSRGSWLNDTNQTSSFTDIFSKPNTPAVYVATVDDRARAFFSAYWQQQTDKVLGRLARYSAPLAVEARALCAQLTATDDFGTYTNHDHLDVLAEDQDEYDGSNVARTVKGSLDSVATRLEASTLVDTVAAARRQPKQVSALGRALHSIADFFAHSNYVELLLWALHERKALSPQLAAVLDCDVRTWPFDPGLLGGVYTPVNPPGSVDPASGLWPGYWQGPSSAETPLVSTVFDKQDTSYSLLTLFARHLESPTKLVTTEQELDLVFSVIDVSGAPLGASALRLFVQLGSQVSDAFEAAGRAARQMLAGWLDNHEAAGRTVANLVRTYDADESAQWARAGRMRYVAEKVREAMGRRLAEQLAARKGRPLPHHTLLSKDHPPDRPDEQVRFTLACHLATELSARVLEWHFGSAAPADDGFEQMRAKWLRHPADQLGSTFDAAKLGALAERCTTSAWPMLARAEVPLEAFAP